VLRRVLLSLLTDSAVVAEVALTRDEAAVEYGAAHGALAMTTPGDTTMATKAEVLNLAAGGGARVNP
jgi:sugar/nucleoside kinase (ribokinase family)